MISKVREKLIKSSNMTKVFLGIRTCLPKAAEGKLKLCIYNETYLEPI